MRIVSILTIALGACRPATESLPTDSSGNMPGTPAPSPWTAVISNGQGFGDSLAVIAVHPTLLVAVGWLGVPYYPGFNEGSAGVVAMDLEAEVATRIAAVSSREPPFHTIPVAAPGDVTGDGHPDALAGLWPARLFHGPFEIGVEPAFTDLDDAAYGIPTRAAACDADGDGDSDLCTTHGIYRMPVTAMSPTTRWDGVSPYVPGVSVVREPTGPVLVLSGGSRFVRVPTNATGEIDTEGLPGWEWPDGYSPHAVHPLDQGDGTDLMITCGREHDDLELHTLWAVREPVWEALIELPGPCDALEVADFDGDGSPEVTIGVRPSVLIVEPDTWSVVATWAADADDEGRFAFGTALESADLDGDGRMDLLVGSPSTGTVEDGVPGRIYISTEVLPTF